MKCPEGHEIPLLSQTEDGDPAPIVTGAGEYRAVWCSRCGWYDDPSTDYVISGCYEQFRTWCVLNDKNPRSRHVVYLGKGDSYKLRGRIIRDHDSVHWIGNYHERSDLEELRCHIEAGRWEAK